MKVRNTLIHLLHLLWMLRNFVESPILMIRSSELTRVSLSSGP